MSRQPQLITAGEINAGGRKFVPYKPAMPESSEMSPLKAGTAHVPLHSDTSRNGRRTGSTQLGAVLSRTIVHHYGRDELLRQVGQS